MLRLLYFYTSVTVKLNILLKQLLYEIPFTVVKLLKVKTQLILLISTISRNRISITETKLWNSKYYFKEENNYELV